MDQCHIPVAAQYSVVDGEITNSKYTYANIDASELADFLLAKFGIDAVERAEEKQIA